MFANCGLLLWRKKTNYRCLNTQLSVKYLALRGINLVGSLGSYIIRNFMIYTSHLVLWEKWTSRGYSRLNTKFGWINNKWIQSFDSENPLKMTAWKTEKETLGGMLEKLWGWEVDRSDSGPCSVMCYGISSFETSELITRELSFVSHKQYLMCSVDIRSTQQRVSWTQSWVSSPKRVVEVEVRQGKALFIGLLMICWKNCQNSTTSLR